jgi:hypothetical protein
VYKSIFKRSLLGGWAVLIAGIFFVIFFPNDLLVPTIVWISGLVLVPVTIGYALFATARAVLRLLSGPAHRLSSAIERKTSGISPRRKWIFGVGAAIVLATLLLTSIELSIKSSRVYELSIQRADPSPRVIEALGQPIHVGWFVLGQLTVSSNGSGREALTIPLQGPRGKGKLDVEATRQEGNWRFSVLRFVADERPFTVDLLDEQRMK